MGRPRLYTDEERRAKAVERVREWRKNNPDKAKELAKKTQKRYRELNPEKMRAYWRADYERNREARVEKSRKYREKNPEKHRESVRNWYSKNPEIAKESSKSYRENNPKKGKANNDKTTKKHQNLIENPKTGPWTKGEEKFLIKNSALPRIELAFLIGRSYFSVSSKIGQLRKAGIIE